MTDTMQILYCILFIGFYFQPSEGQTTISVTAYVGDPVTLQCTLSGTFTLPGWVGPPNLLPYTNQGDSSETINPAAPAVSRLQYASNKKDLILLDAQTSDSGDYKCSYTALGDHTITLEIGEKNCECECSCKRLIIPCIIFCGLGIIILIVLMVLYNQELIGDFHIQLGLLVIPLVLLLVSIGLGAGVHIKDCCECSCSDCSCANDCCDGWVGSCATAFIVISLLGIVTAVIRAVLIHIADKDKMPPESQEMTKTPL